MKFDHQSPWGAHLPDKNVRLHLRLCQKLSALRGLKRLAYWLRHPLKYKLDGPVDTEIWGLKLRLMPRGNVAESKMLFMPGQFDPGERDFLARQLRPGAVMIDLGANAGAYSLWAFRCLGNDCRVVAIEPDPEMIGRIRFNAASNGADCIELEPVVVSDHDGRVPFFIKPENRGQNRLVRDFDEVQELELECVTLRTLMQRRGLERVDVLKIDVEGHECQVLEPFFEQADRSLWPEWIIGETCTDTQQQGMNALLLRHGYRHHFKGRMNFISRLERA